VETGLQGALAPAIPIWIAWLSSYRSDVLRKRFFARSTEQNRQLVEKHRKSELFFNTVAVPPPVSSLCRRFSIAFLFPGLVSPALFPLMIFSNAFFFRHSPLISRVLHF
jgi:hypothetical protein